MRVFLSEFACGGAWPEPEIGGSLAREGRAMLTAAVEDFVGIRGVTVTTTWDARLGPSPFRNAQTIVVDAREDELPIFRELARLSEATLVIAPETNRILEQRCRIVEGAGGRLLGPTSDAIRLCASKAATTGALDRAGIPTIPTLLGKWPRRLAANGTFHEVSTDPTDLVFPLVIKPDDGAGSQNTYLVRSMDDLERLPLVRTDIEDGALWQPFIAGRAVSVALIVADDGEPLHVFPPAEQTLSADGRFRYLGGVVPARGIDHALVQEVARGACRAIDGLRGFIGLDLIVPDSDPDRPLVVEINPRLTTSYIGYRRLTSENLADRLLHPDRRPIEWRDASIVFSTNDE